MQALFGLRTKEPAAIRVPSPASASEVAKATEEGRLNLAQGQTGLAIEAFQRALSLGPPSATALNGMGVAYARLGRPDVAERFFREAIVIDPQDQRYAKNLARLMDSPAFDTRLHGDIAAAAEIAPDTAKTDPAPAVAAAEPKPERLVRVSSHEYRIRTVAPAGAPPDARVAVAKNFKPLVRIEFEKRSNDNAEATDEAVVPNKVEAAKRSGPVTIPNPYAQTAERIDPRFKPIVRLQLPKAKPATRGEVEKIAMAEVKAGGGR